MNKKEESSLLADEDLPRLAIQQVEEHKAHLHTLVEEIRLSSVSLHPSDKHKGGAKVQMVIQYPDGFLRVAKDIYENGQVLQVKPMSTGTPLEA